MEKLKSDLVKSKEEVLTCMADNIDDQNSNTSLAGLMSVFHLSSNETYNQREDTFQTQRYTWSILHFNKSQEV